MSANCQAIVGELLNKQDVRQMNRPPVLLSSCMLFGLPIAYLSLTYRAHFFRYSPHYRIERFLFDFF
jgi:hypothetical protein